VENRWSHQVPSFGNPAGGTKLERQSGSDLPISGAGRGARLELWVTRIKADAQIANPARSFRSGEPCWPADSSNRSSAEGRGRPGDATVQGGVAHRADFPASAVGAGATAAQLGTTVSRCGLSIDSTHCPSRSCSAPTGPHHGYDGSPRSLALEGMPAAAASAEWLALHSRPVTCPPLGERT
jgi:hypothetical protein